jgi:hypothetical protein
MCGVWWCRCSEWDRSLHQKVQDGPNLTVVVWCVPFFSELRRLFAAVVGHVCPAARRGVLR